MIRVDISNNMQAITAALARLEKAGANPQPAMQDIGEYLVVAIKNRFKTKIAPDGSTWADNSIVTQKRKKGRNDPLKGETKNLSRNIFAEPGHNEVTVGSTMEYAAVQQFGAKQGQFGKNRRNTPLPWGDIPARPFLGLSKEDELAIVDILIEHLESQLK